MTPGGADIQRFQRRHKWFVYLLIDPRDAAVRYVGVSHVPKRRYREHLKEAVQGRTTPKDDWVRSLLATGEYVPNMEIVDSGHGDGVDAERAWIAKMREAGCPLTNLTDGGEGTQGYHHSEDTREKIGESNRRNYALGLTKPSMHRLGVEVSEETRERMRSSQLGRKRSEASKRKQSESFIGKHPRTRRPEEVRERIRDRARRLREKRIAMGLDPYPQRRRK